MYMYTWLFEHKCVIWIVLWRPEAHGSIFMKTSRVMYHCAKNVISDQHYFSSSGISWFRQHCYVRRAIAKNLNRWPMTNWTFLESYLMWLSGDTKHIWEIFPRRVFTGLWMGRVYHWKDRASSVWSRPLREMNRFGALFQLKRLK